MPRYFLTRLAIEGFRGVNNEADPLDIRFRPDTVNSVFADNGLGKSSIFEALYYAIFGTIPKLQPLQAQRPQDYYCNRFHSQHSALIELEFLPDDGGRPVAVRVQRDAAGNRTVSSSSNHPDPEGFLATLREAFALLDYRNFARFIEDSPLERGRTFSALLGLSDYSDRRQALQSASDSRTLNSDLEIRVLTASIAAAQQGAQQALTALRTSYQNVTGGQLDDIGRLEDYAADVTRALGDVELLRPHLAGRTLGEIDFEQVKTVIKTAEGGEKRRELEQTIQAISALEALAAHDLSAAQEEQRQLEELVDERDGLLARTRGDQRLYDAAHAVIAKGVWTDDEKCPLCESELGSSISAHVTERLGQYAGAAAKAAEIRETWQGSAWQKGLSALENAAPLGIDPQKRQLAGLDARVSSGDITTDELAAAIEWTAELAGQVSGRLNFARDKKAALESELPASLVQLTEHVEYGRQFKDALSRYRASQKDEAGWQARRHPGADGGRSFQGRRRCSPRRRPHCRRRRSLTSTPNTKRCSARL